MHLLGAWARPARTPLVWHLHDYVARRPLSARCSNAALRDAPGDRPLAERRRRLSTLGGTLPPIHAIWNAVDLERFSPSGTRLDLDGRSGLPASGRDVVRVGLVATFAAWKGHHLFLEAIARLPPSLDVRAYVIGGPVYETEKSEVSIESFGNRGAARHHGSRWLHGLHRRSGAGDSCAGHRGSRQHGARTLRPGDRRGNGVRTGGRGECRRRRRRDRDPRRRCMAVPPGDAGALAGASNRWRGCRPAAALGDAARARPNNVQPRRLARELLEVYERVIPSGRTARSSRAQREPLRRCGDVSDDPGARRRGRARHDLVVCPLLRRTAQRRAHGARSSAAHAGCRAIEPPAHGLEGPPIPGAAAGGAEFDVVVCHQAWPYAIFGPVIRRAGLPLVFWLHTAGDGRHWLERWARVAARPGRRQQPVHGANLAGWFPGCPGRDRLLPAQARARPRSDSARRARSAGRSIRRPTMS